MEFVGLVYKIMPPVKGTSARGEWTKQEVIFEMPDEFNRKLCVGFWGDKALEAAALVPGERVEVSINIESKEYNGRWYTEARAWKLQRQPKEVEAPAADMPPMPSEEPAYASIPVDDMPF